MSGLCSVGDDKEHYCEKKLEDKHKMLLDTVLRMHDGTSYLFG